ncbi:carbohydrate kinase family protein [Patescibacteria group bacterium]|nr:carbohydrate kinase family protein [Patescibacteria group bacterium]MBU0879727.1 carbohydrate kinase family protein [Patescibacteria group bacterium]MBU0880056.1 carbohydrate kinase family protein [Patescibacteria group bacterium]MBU0897954.1 carbohydrate kinase family protein [Patescibacteria group bacterium]MBU1062765.1 carbohydrate kinase family protein [Patescibacteria group bacterium]
MKYDIITIGGATEDIAFFTKEGVIIDNKKDLTKQKLFAFEYGAKIKVDKSFSNFGGGAANSAVSFANLGFNVATLVAIGEDDRGQRIVNNFKQQKVDVSLVQKISKTESGFSFLLVGPANEHIVFSNRAANNQLSITNYELRIIKDAKWVYLASLSDQWQKILDKVCSLIDISSAKDYNFAGVKIVWNPGHRQILSGLKTIGKYLSKVSVLIINKDEAIELVMSDKNCKNKKRDFFEEINNLLSVLYSYGPQIVLITKGKDGVNAFDGKKVYFQQAIKGVKQVDTTGVGDAFGSSFIAGLELYQGDIKKALYLGVKNAASVVSKQGAQNGLLKQENKKSRNK